MVTAPIAVKCRPQIASANRPAAIQGARRLFHCWKPIMAADASKVPMTRDEMTSPESHFRLPGTMSASIPAKCIRPMPPPITAPPMAARQR